jgi:hypothetical protein
MDMRTVPTFTQRSDSPSGPRGVTWAESFTGSEAPSLLRAVGDGISRAGQLPRGSSELVIQERKGGPKRREPRLCEAWLSADSLALWRGRGLAPLDAHPVQDEADTKQ